MQKTYDLQNGKKFNIEYQVEHESEKGPVFICKSNIVYISPDVIPMDITKSFTFLNNSVQEKLSPCLPMTHKNYKIDGGNALVIAKRPELFLLKDVQKYFKGAIPPVHIAWIINSIYNVCCYLEYIKVTHGNITTDHFYIAPETHMGALLGGWWGAKKKGDDVEPLNRFNALVKKSKAKIDLEAVKAIGLELIGDQVDGVLTDFLKQPSTGDAKSDYKTWGEALATVFGPRKFVKMPFDEEEIYRAEEIEDAVSIV